MENSHLSGQETVPVCPDESSLQVSSFTSLLRHNSVEFLAEEKVDTFSGDDASVSDFKEEEDIGNNEDYLQIEDVDALEANNQNQKNYELFIGMDFSSDESAYKAYRKYGGNHGFDVRRQQTSKKNKKLVRMVYVCSKEGLRQEPKVKKSFSRPTPRCGCKARMSCYLQSNGRYKIVTFEPNHNHDLVRIPMKHLLKSNRAMSISQRQHADDADMSGISAKTTIEMMSREVGGRVNLGFIDKDLRNYIYRKRTAAMEKGDAGAVLEYFQKKNYTSEYSVNIPFLGKFNINLFRVVWRTAYVVGVLSLTNPFDTNPISVRTWLDLKCGSHGMFVQPDVHGLIWIGEEIKIRFESIELETQLDKHSFHLLCG